MNHYDTERGREFEADDGQNQSARARRLLHFKSFVARRARSSRARGTRAVEFGPSAECMKRKLMAELAPNLAMARFKVIVSIYC